ncbi:hypothetical protein AB0E69_36695 [Kribbella sp. NPDC026611]|uniref:hypothetical protein n=1 Tax=Kribbella sp. NPDC026611 TaxID=3154911 RepID=UPI0033DA26A3
MFGRLTAGELPAGKSQYALEAELTRPSYSTLSTQVRGRWEFQSSAQDTVLPLLGIRYQPRVDINNTVARTPVTRFPVIVVPSGGATLPKLRSAKLQYSADGKSWQDAVLRRAGEGRYVATFPTPASGDSISLKTTLIDAAGNSSELTTMDAYHLR